MTAESLRFSYDAAFSRNIGWVTEAEQRLLRSKRVAVAGLGGVGGVHVMTLARLGIGAFSLADSDQFEFHNCNRQAGATISTLGMDKVEVLAGMARDVNPEIDLKLFRDGVTDANIDAFLDGVDIYVDGLDFFVFGARRAVFAACRRKGIPAVTAAPLGMGTAVVNFLPRSMSFDDYFGLTDEAPAIENGLRFLLGLSPARLQMSYLADPTRVRLAERKGPSTIMACQMCAGVAATEALKILLGRGQVLAAPRGAHFDAYLNRLALTWRPGGHRNPLQRVAFAIGKRKLGATLREQTPGPEAGSRARAIEQILDAARWAPSGDNTQPWRFQIISDDHLVVHGFDTRERCVYDLGGRASQMAVGSMLETLRIAASQLAMTTEVRRRLESPETNPTFDVRLNPSSASTAPDPLGAFVRLRSVQRRPLRTRPLLDAEIRAVESAPRAGFSVSWLPARQGKSRVAKLTCANYDIRLAIPETYQGHRDIIEWGARFSQDRVPDAALGADPLTLRLMRWAMQSWERIAFMNRYLGGTIMPRLQLDLLPALACGAHAVLVADRAPTTIDDYVAAGGAMQRFWLTATSLGLQL